MDVRSECEHRRETGLFLVGKILSEGWRKATSEVEVEIQSNTGFFGIARAQRGGGSGRSEHCVFTVAKQAHVTIV